MDSGSGQKDGACYLCASNPTPSNLTGFTMYTRDGSVEGTWAAASDECTDKLGCTSQHGFFADALYAQVLAYSVGLGTIVSSEDKIRSHLHGELGANCVRARGNSLVDGCDDAGIVILTGRPKPGPTDWCVRPCSQTLACLLHVASLLITPFFNFFFFLLLFALERGMPRVCGPLALI